MLRRGPANCQLRFTLVSQGAVRFFGRVTEVGFLKSIDLPVFPDCVRSCSGKATLRQLDIMVSPLIFAGHVNIN